MRLPSSSARSYSAILKADPCVYCHGPVDTVDHIVPKVLGGSNSWGNLAACCAACNLAKGSRSVLEVLLGVTWPDRVVARLPKPERGPFLEKRLRWLQREGLRHSYVLRLMSWVLRESGMQGPEWLLPRRLINVGGHRRDRPEPGMVPYVRGLMALPESERPTVPERLRDRHEEPETPPEMLGVEPAPHDCTRPLPLLVHGRPVEEPVPVYAVGPPDWREFKKLPRLIDKRKGIYR